jgi:hypothetical protein
MCCVRDETGAHSLFTVYAFHAPEQMDKMTIYAMSVLLRS